MKVLKGNLLADGAADLGDNGAVVHDDDLLSVVDQSDLQRPVHLLELERRLKKGEE